MSAVDHIARLLDHLVLPVADLSSAQARYGKLGFTSAAEARHPFGTGNACVFLADGTYLEPLAVTVPADYDAAAVSGNVFVARDRAFRSQRGEEGLSAIVFSADDARADHRRFVDRDISAGDMLEFSRPMLLPDGSRATGSFRLAFAADRAISDFFLFTCERLQPLPADRSALERHRNGVTGLSGVMLSATKPADFRFLLEACVQMTAVETAEGGLDLQMRNGVTVSVLDPAARSTVLGGERQGGLDGLRGCAVVFRVADLGQTERCLLDNAVPFTRKDNRLIVPDAPGQGVVFIYGE